jgi:hypothetical protein
LSSTQPHERLRHRFRFCATINGWLCLSACGIVCATINGVCAWIPVLTFMVASPFAFLSTRL